MLGNVLCFINTLFFFLLISTSAEGIQEFRIVVENRMGYLREQNPAVWRTKKALSKIKFQDVQIFDLLCEGRWKFRKCGYARFQAALGAIVHASVSDSDYVYTNRRLAKDLIALSYHNASDGEFVLANAGLGYCFAIPCLKLSIAPLIGFSFRQLGFAITKGYLAYAYRYDLPEWTRNCLYDDLHSTLRNYWYSPWVGIDFQWNPFSKLVLQGKAELHSVLHSARYYWNLRSLRFSERTVGAGALAETDILYAMTPFHDVGIKIGAEIWDTRDSFSREDEIGSSAETAAIKVPSLNYFFHNVVVGMVYRNRF